MPELLEPEERLLGAFHALHVTRAGLFGGWKTEDFPVLSYLLVTNRRLIFWGHGFGRRQHVLSYFHKDIVAVGHSQGWRKGELVVRLPGVTVGRFTRMPDAETAAQMIREQIANVK